MGAGRPKLSLGPVSPQLAVSSESPPEGREWIFELKLDGFRIIARVEPRAVRLYSRNKKDWTARFPVITDALRRLRHSVVLDGEVVALDETGRPSFQNLQQGKGDLVYYVFDILECDGRDLRAEVLRQRKQMLAKVLTPIKSGPLRLCEFVSGDSRKILSEVCEHGLEGIVCKRLDSRYNSSRSADWVKVKCDNVEEFVLGGWTDSEAQDFDFGALLLGGYDESNKLQYIGKVGTGFTHQQRRELLGRLKELSQESCPFDPAPRVGRANWIRPVLVARIRFTERTRDGKVRHPAFEGLREDKSAREVPSGKPAT